MHMGTFDSRFAAYESAMQRNNYFGLQGEARGKQFGRYAEALQYSEAKAARKQEGREFARQLAQERKGISMAEQSALSEGLTGNNVSTPAVEATTKPETANGVKIKKKMKVGTSKTGFKYYLIDAQGNTYAVDKSDYNSAKRGKNFKLTAEPVEMSKLPNKVKKEAGKIRSALVQAPKPPKINVINDPQLYRQQRADMYEKLWGNFSHPSNTPLGTAKPTVSNGVKTWEKYLSDNGKTYEKPVSGVVEADKRAERIIKGNEIKRNIEEALSKKTAFTPESLEKWSGHGRNPGLEAMGEYYRELEKRPTIETVVDKVDDLNRKIASQSSKIDGLAQTVSQQGAKIDGLSQTIAKQSNKIDDLGRRLAKTNKRLAVGVTIASLAAGAVGYLLGNKSKEESKSVEQNPEDTALAKQDNTDDVSVDEKTAANISVTADSTKNVEAVLNQAPADSTAVAASLKQPADTLAINSQTQTSVESAAQTKDAEMVTGEKRVADKKTLDTNSSLLLDAEGKYLTKKGDTFWKIAERYLKGKFKDEPEKFANLPKERKDTIIQKECERIMKQNGYWYDENHNLPVPMLNQKIKVEIVEKIDKAA